jgi:hypothetical protein
MISGKTPSKPENSDQTVTHMVPPKHIKQDLPGRTPHAITINKNQSTYASCNR